MQNALTKLKAKFPKLLDNIHFITGLFIDGEPGNYWKEFTQGVIKFEKQFRSFEVTYLEIEDQSKYYEFKIREFLDQDDQALIFLLAMIDLTQNDNITSLNYSIEKAKYLIMKVQPKEISAVDVQFKQLGLFNEKEKDNQTEGKDEKKE
ncbi:UNKNOWN [Stylonychia lemnae]|uniref:Uncharacterized protein n=1 Tax=Stylonychia lemnae TaxID=5949 RepID=A0A078ADL8_STYLE|nr:UNKNOWN [Stylonychia lemnae]|eukprot:CDW79627.1 UNKNOWN [Stylonychia lemnae]